MSNSALEPELEADLLQHIMRASSSVYEVATETPLEPLTVPGMEGVDLLVKREDLQRINAYKLRGAYYALKTAVENNPNLQTVVTASAGNHAQGVAMSARALGLHADIFMPLSTPQVKQDAVRFHGGNHVTIHLVGDNFDAASAAANEFLRANGGAQYIHPFDDLHTIAGQATIAHEIVKSLGNDQLDYLFVPIGGGGLAAGVAAYMHLMGSKTKVIGVEGVGQASMKAAFDAGKSVSLETVDGFCDGSAVKTAGELTRNICANFVYALTVVTNDEVCAAMEGCFKSTSRFIAEPSGAMALAGLQKMLRQDPDMFEGKRVGFICSGANVDPSKFSNALNRAAVGAHKRRYLEIAVPEGQGSLLDLLETYFKDVNVQDFQYGKKYTDVGFPIIGFEAPEHLMDELVSRLKQDGYKTNDVSNAIDVRDRAVGCEASLLQNPVLMNVDFPERKGALREFMGSVSDVANLCYFNYQYSGDNTGHALMGFEFDSPEKRNEFLSRAATMNVVTCVPVDEDVQKRVFGHVPQQRTATTSLACNIS